MKAEHETNMNLASSKLNLGSSNKACRIPSALLVYPYKLLNAFFKAPCKPTFASTSFNACPIEEDVQRKRGFSGEIG